MNPYTFYYLWNSKYKNYLNILINKILKLNSQFLLQNTFNNDCNYLRSYLFLESDKELVIIDFNKKNSNIILENNLIIFKYLKTVSKKKVLLIIFNSYKGTNKVENNIYQIYQRPNNSQFLKLLLSNSFEEQNKLQLKDIIDYIYNLDDNFNFSYLKEEKLRERLYQNKNEY